MSFAAGGTAQPLVSPAQVARARWIATKRRRDSEKSVARARNEK
jgi:hypothetical protein